MVSCVREKCIYQWKTLQNSLDYQFRLLTGWWKRMNADLASKKLLCNYRWRVPTRYVEDKIYGLKHVEQYLKEDKAV